MKRIFLAFLLLVCVVLSAIVYSGPSYFKPVDCKFDDGTTALTVDSVELCSATKGTIAPDTNWFPSDITATAKDFWIPVRHTFEFSCPTPTAINIQVAGDGVTGDKIFIFNSGNQIGADEGNQFPFILFKGVSYNIQHKTGTQNCSVFISETFSDDL